MQKSMTSFFNEAKLIDGAENAILELSDEIGNGIILSGEIYGKDTQEKLIVLGKKHDLLVLAQGLNVLYNNPEDAH